MSASFRRSPPKYRHYKPKNLGVVRIKGKDHYFPGPYRSPESLQAYYQLLAKMEASGGEVPVEPPADKVTGFAGVSVVVERYLAHAKRYYAKNDPNGKELQCIKYALEPLIALFGLSDVSQFGPKSLKLVRERMISLDWSRNLINSRVNLIKRCFKWAVAEELVPPSVLHGLQAVQGLRYGRSEARETQPIRPAQDEHVEVTLPFLSPVLQAMVRLHRMTGMRPCELVIMRPCDIDRTQEVWVYEPSTHKNMWRGHQRLIPLGPKAKEVLTPYLDRPAEAYLFSPRESEEIRNAERRKNRKSPMTPSQAKRKPKAKPARAKRDRFDPNSYRRAIDYAVKAANKKRKKDGLPAISPWFPLQLRHSRATEVRKQYGLDGAQSTLGHKNADVTQVYAEKNLELAVRIARETG